MDRRKFLKNSSLAFAGSQAIGNRAYGNSFTEEKKANTPAIRDYKILGKTGFAVSDIGAGGAVSETVLRVLLEAGVNYIDAGEVYENGNRERTIGNVIKDFDRKKIFITSKLLEENSFFTSAEDVINRTHKVLERLQSDYVDCMLIHGVENSKFLNDPAFHKGMDIMKAEGKVKYTGISCHGNAWLLQPEESLEKVLMAAIDDGRFDLFLMTYNFMNAPVAENILKACAEKGIGTAIMKSNPVLLYQVLDRVITSMEERDRDPGEAYYAWRERYKIQTEKAREYFSRYDKKSDKELIEASLTYVLSNPDAHTVCVEFKNLTDVEQFLSLSGSRLDQHQTGILNNYLEYYSFLNCRIGCNECEKACPHGIPVNTIMRYNYYFQNKKQEKEAMQLYARLQDKSVDRCKGCPGYCEEACPFGVSTRSLLAMAHQNLTFEQGNYA